MVNEGNEDFQMLGPNWKILKKIRSFLKILMTRILDYAILSLKMNSYHQI